MRFFFSIILFLCAGLSTVAAQEPSPLLLEAQLVSMGTMQRVELSFEAERLRGNAKPEGLTLIYELKTLPEGQLSARDTIVLSEAKVEKVNATFYYSFMVEPSNIRESSLTVWLVDRVDGKQVLRELTFQKPDSPVSFGLMNQSDPNRISYVKVGDTIMLNDTFDKPVFLIRFDQEFMPAAPPMATDFGAYSPEMKVGGILRQQTNRPFFLHSPGLYFAQQDTSSNLGLGIRVVSEDFPKFNQVENLAAAMIYISTNSEINLMATSENKKMVFDNFWLNVGGTVENAQRLIRIYYQRVAYANRNFTSHKEGWKTDRGMVYIIYGRPDEVIVKSEGEQWVYLGQGKDYRKVFEFVRKKNIFSNNHYELLRSTRYKKIWYDQVQRWRKGIISF